METENFSDKLIFLGKMIEALIKKLSADGSLDKTDIMQIREAFEACIGALDYEEACIDEACQTAGGHTADKNRAEKISTDSVANYIDKLEI